MAMIEPSSAAAKAMSANAMMMRWKRHDFFVLVVPSAGSTEPDAGDGV